MENDRKEIAIAFRATVRENIQLISIYPEIGILINTKSKIRRRVIHPSVSIYYKQLNMDTIQVLSIRHNSQKPPKFK
jgi:plasmid stabilization system protein ParE